MIDNDEYENSKTLETYIPSKAVPFPPEGDGLGPLYINYGFYAEEQGTFWSGKLLLLLFKNLDFLQGHAVNPF